MKKKNKAIIGALSTIGIGSMVIAPALAFANYQSPNNKDATSQTSTKKAKMSSLATTPVTTINSHTFNDDAYLQTLNQAAITNPVGKAWTVQSSLSYFKTHLQNDINVFNCATIFRWVVIQNFNYNLNELVGTLSANSNFKVDVPNFNYTLSNIKNNGNIANFSCTLNVTIDFVITSKSDGATLSFTNNYTYNNLKYTPTITTNGYNGYGAFALSNNANGTLTVNNATYFSGMQLSGNWTNSDFSNLLKANWLPTINPSTSITTSNYTYALADMVQRASHSISLNDNQSQFMSILPTTMIDTFNLGYKFANAASIVIVMDTKGITPNANNDYTILPSTNVTLKASQTLSSINLKNPDLAYQWEKLSNGTWTSVGSETSKTYTFQVANTTIQYRLYVYNTKNSSFYLTSNTITINPTVQNLMIDSSASTYDYGASCTLSINKNSVYDRNTVKSYQWYVNTANSNSGGSAISKATSPNYSFDVTSANYYYLVLTFDNDTTLTSNAYFVTPSQSTFSVKNLTPSTRMTSNGLIYNGSKVTLGISKSDMDWIKTGGGKNLTYTLYQYNPYPTSASDQWVKVDTPSANNPDQSSANYPVQFSFYINQGTPGQYVKDSQGKYKVVITNSNPNYNLSSTPIILTTDSTLSLIPSINGIAVTPNNSNYYQEEYGSQVSIQVNSDNWNTSGWQYQWQYYDQETGGWTNITDKGTSSSYSFNLKSNSHTTYRVHITDGSIDMYSNPISVTAKPLGTSKIMIEDDTTGKEVTGPVQQGDKITISSGFTGASTKSNGNWQYQWQTQDANGQPKGIQGANTSSYTIQANKNGIYRLKITNSKDPNNPVYTPWQSINVTNNYPLVITATNTTNTTTASMVVQTFEYNDSITLSMDTSNGNWNNQPNVTGLTYSWYEVGNSIPLQTGSKETYGFTLTQNGNEYYLVITDLSGFKLTSNTIAINYETANVTISADQVNNEVATPLTNPNNITQGTTVKLDINSGNLPNTEGLTYQWQYLKDGKTWTKVSKGSSPYQFNVTNATAGSYKLVITNSDNKVVGSSNVINIGLAHHPLYIVNETNSSMSSSTTSSSSTTVPSSINANYNQSNITLGISGYWQNQTDVNSSNFKYQWQEQTQGSTNWTNINDANESTYEVPPVTTSGTSYRLVITENGDTNFKLTSNPLTVTLNKANVVIEVTSPANVSTYSFGENVTLGINQEHTTGIDLSSGNYTYTWQYQNAQGDFVTFTQTKNSDSLTFAIIGNSVFRLEIKSGNLTTCSNLIYLNTTMPTLTITAKKGNTTGTSFAIGSVIDVSASIGTLPSSLTAKNGNTTVSVIGDSSANASSYVLGGNTAFRAKYTYKDSTNSYYNFTIKSAILNVNATSNPITIDAFTTGTTTPTVSNTYTFDVASNVTLAIEGKTSWDSYSVPSDYTLSYQWYHDGKGVTSTSSNTYSIPSLTNSTAGQYQLWITCVNGKKTIFTVKSNTITISPNQVNFSVGYDDNSGTYIDTTYTTNYGAQGIILSIDSSTVTGISDANLTTGATYQWKYWDASTSKWTDVPSTMAKVSTGSTLKLSSPLLASYTYKLIVSVDGAKYTSNTFSLVVNPTTQNLNIAVENQTAPYTNLKYDTSYTLEPTINWWQNINENNPNLACQWYVNYGNGKWTKVTSSGFNKPDGDTSPILTIKLMQDASYKLEITSTDTNFGTAGVLTSNIISLSITSTGEFTIQATYDLNFNGFTYDSTGGSINVPYDMSFPNITLSSSNSSYWQNQCNNPNGTYTYQLQVYQQAIPGDNSVSAGWVNFADYYKNLGVNTDWTTSDGKFTGFTLTGAPYSLKMSAMWRLAITNNYTGKVTYSNSIVINVANPDIIAQSSVPDVSTSTSQSINKQATGNTFTVVVPYSQHTRVYLNPVWNTYVNIHYPSSWTTSAYLEQYDSLNSNWITPTGSAITWTFGSEKVQQKNSSGTETTVTVYYIQFDNNSNESSTSTYKLALEPYSNDYPAIHNQEAGVTTAATLCSQNFTVIYGAIQSLSISAITNDSPSSTPTEVIGQLGQGFSVSLNKTSIQDVNTIIKAQKAQGHDVHGYWVKVVNGQESVIQTAPNYKQIFCNAFLNSTEFETIMKSYIALGGYGKTLANTATYGDFENWNASFQELPGGADELGIFNNLVITATNKSSITVDDWSDTKNNWVAGTSVPAGSLFTWTLPYTWIDSNNLSKITPTVSGTSSGSTLMTLDFLTYETAKAINTSLTQEQFNNAFNTNGGNHYFGFSVINPTSNQLLVHLCQFNFTSSNDGKGSYSSFVNKITVTVNTSFVDNYINVPLTAIDNETIKYIVAPSSYWTTNSSGEMVPSSNYPSTAMPPVESNLIYVTVPNLDKNGTFTCSNFTSLQSNWEPANPNASDIPENPFKQIAKNYYQVPYDQAVTLSSNVAYYIANLDQIAPGYSFYVGYYFNGDLANWEQLLNTGMGHWGYNFQQVFNATSFDLSNFPIANNETIQLALFYTPDNNNFIKSSANSNQYQPKDLNVIWESSPVTFTIAQHLSLAITPPSGTSLQDAENAGFHQLGDVYSLPANYQYYVVSFDSNSSIYWWNNAQSNLPYPSMTTNPINMQTRSERDLPTSFTGTYSFDGSNPTIYNNYGIIGEFLEFQTPADSHHWSILSTWFPNLYSMFAAWVADGSVAWPSIYESWRKSDSFKTVYSNPYQYTRFLPSPLIYPIEQPTNTGDQIGVTIVNGTPYNIKGQAFSKSSNWLWYVSRGNVHIWSSFSENQGIGGDFNYNDPNNISFNYNTNINNFVNGSHYAGTYPSKYSYSAYAPLKFSIKAILFNNEKRNGIFNKPVALRLVVFALNPQTLDDTYYTSSDTFANVGLKVFKYTTNPIIILPSNDASIIS